MSASSSKKQEKKREGGAPGKDGEPLGSWAWYFESPNESCETFFYQGFIVALAKRLEPKKGKTRRTPNERKKKVKKCTVVCQGFLHQTEVGRVKDGA